MTGANRPRFELRDPAADASVSEGAPQRPDGLLLTGATGFLGMSLLARYLERTDRTVYALIRARDDAEAATRLEAAIEAMVGPAEAYAGRAVAIAGDIQRPGLGLDDDRRAWLAARVREIIHAAASVSFAAPLEEMREINVEGTRRMLDFAELCARGGSLRSFGHVSTAYVAGTHGGVFREDELEVGQDFCNAYERSKFEAERLVRARAGLPVVISRPSIVVGERATGWTAAFNVLYAPLRAYTRGAFVAIPGRRGASVDVVPVDYVADAISHLLEEPHARSTTYHLVAGARATTVGGVLDLAAAYFGRGAPPVLPPSLYLRLAHPLLLRLTSGKRREALRRSEVYFPYFATRVRYDDATAQARLRSVGIEAAPARALLRPARRLRARQRLGTDADRPRTASPGCGRRYGARSPRATARRRHRLTAPGRRPPTPGT